MKPAVTIAAILTRAQALTNNHWCCAHIAINDAAHDLGAFATNEQAKLLYAHANGLDPKNIPRCIHRFWDTATAAERAASWRRAITMAEGE